MRRYRRPDRQMIRIGNILPEVTGEIDTRRREVREPGRDTDQLRTVPAVIELSY